MSSFYKKYFFTILCLFFVLFVQNAFAQKKTWQYTSNSVLSEGDWYKIKIEKGTGIYKLTYDDLKKIGLNNPADVKIYGYGGWILEEDFNKPYVDDLPQISIWMSNDRSNFGKDDYILFYARGDIKWEYDTLKEEFVQIQNPYSFDSYCFVTESTTPSKLMEVKPSLESGSVVVNTFNDYVLHEKEEVNIGETGREFYGENFLMNNKRQITFSTQGATSDPAKIRYEYVSKATLSSCILKLSLNGNYLGEKASSTTSENYTIYGTPTYDVIETQNLKDENKIDLEFLKNDNKVSNAYLNYVRINYMRQLKPYGAFTLFRNTKQSDNLTYQIANANNSILVFDVTDNVDVSRIETRLSGTTMSFSASNSTIREYALVDLSKSQDFPKPTLISGKIKNQNLHALANVGMVIIAPEIFYESAQELTQLHETQSGLKSHVVTPELIYNEFSSGKPDVTAYRRFMKMFYDRASGDGDKLRYLTLFGDGTYDNRFIIDKIWTDENKKKAVLLSYHSKESLLELDSYITDDYIGFLNDNVNINNINAASLDIGIGRLPVQTVQEAKDMVAKIKDYMMNQNKGLWLNNITFVVDDFVASNNSYGVEEQHIIDAENFSKYIESNYPNFIINKIYEDAYVREEINNTFKYPTATQALLDRINNGTLTLNFIGHGNSSWWTHEQILHSGHIRALNNDKLPLWITVTCDFSRFDSKDRSGGEMALLKPKGGAIGLFSTSRTVYVSSNTVMNENITKHLFTKENGKPMRLGDILRNTKNESALSSNSSKLRFVLLGDPALRLAYPDETHKVEVSQIKGIDVSTGTINIKALDDVDIVGHITDESGNIISDYNGVVESVIFDSEQELKTLGNGYTSDKGKNYKTYPNTLFAGRVEVKNGEFQIRFVAPKNILNLNAKGKMNFYAYDATGQREAQGSYYNYTVGGSNTDVQEEKNPPVIEKLLLNTTQVNLANTEAIYVNPMPKFHVEVSDDTGINLSSTGEQNITLRITNGTDEEEYILTPYFVGVDGSTKKGSITFTIPELKPGNYTLEFNVSDVFNNLKSVKTNIIVTNDTDPSNYVFEIWGNPAKDLTKFVFKTRGTPANNVSIKIMVYSLSGQLIWLTEQKDAVNTLNVYEYEWDLSSKTGGRVTPGIYICTGQVIIDGKAHPVQAKKIIVAN